MPTKAEILITARDQTNTAFKSVERSLAGLQTASMGVSSAFAALSTAGVVGFARTIINDLDKLNDIADNINGKSFCALGDGAASPIFSSLKYFREEYEQHITGRGCPFDPAKSTAWADRPEVNA